MRVFVLCGLAVLSGCRLLAPPLVEPVVLEASLEGGTYRAGAEQGVGATIVNRSRRSIVYYGQGGLYTVRLFRDANGPLRHADAPSDSTRPLGPYWEQAYHLGFAPEPGTVSTLDWPIIVIEGGGRFVTSGVRFQWPRDPGTYTVSICSGYAPDDRTPSREVCAPPVRVVLE